MAVKKVKKNTKKSKRNPILLHSIKGAVTALIVTVAAVLALALIVKQSGMDETKISAINQAIKVISIFIAALISSRSVMEKQLFTGCISGLIYVAVGYIAFSLLEGEFGDVMLLLADLAMGAIVGALVGLIFGKLLRKQKC